MIDECDLCRTQYGIQCTNGRGDLMSRVGRRPSTTQDHITDVALDLFTTRGFDEVSVDDVAKAAGIALTGPDGLLKALTAQVVEAALDEDALDAALGIVASADRPLVLAGRGAVLAGAYSLGLGLPFVLLAAGISRLAGAFGWLRDHHRAISIVGGVALMVLGVLMVAGVWDRAMVWLQTEWISSFRPVI